MPRSSATTVQKSSRASRSKRSRWDSGTSKPVLWSAPPTMPMNRSQPVRACWLGRTPYRQAWDLQAELVAARRDSSAPDTLLMLEHPHVFTMGKAASPDHLLWDQHEPTRRDVEGVSSHRG